MARNGRRLRGRRGRINYQDQSVPKRRPRDRSKELVDARCPRCDAELTVRPRYNAAICPGCGWLLKIEPYWGTVSIDDVARVAEPAVPGGGQKVYTRRYRDAWLKILENWQQRRIVHSVVETDAQGRKLLRLKFRSQHELLLDEQDGLDFGARVLKPGEEDNRDQED